MEQASKPPGGTATLKDGFHVQQFSVVGQYGTHIDAPIHFVEGGRWLEEIELKDLFLPMNVHPRSPLTGIRKSLRQMVLVYS